MDAYSSYRHVITIGRWGSIMTGTLRVVTAGLVQGVYDLASSAQRVFFNRKGTGKMAKFYKFEVYQEITGIWNWRILSTKGKEVAVSADGFATKGKASRSVKTVIAGLKKLFASDNVD